MSEILTRGHRATDRHKQGLGFDCWHTDIGKVEFIPLYLVRREAVPENNTIEWIERHFHIEENNETGPADILGHNKDRFEVDVIITAPTASITNLNFGSMFFASTW